LGLASRPKLLGLALGCGMVVRPTLLEVWHDCQTQVSWVCHGGSLKINLLG